jgi:hypothetical protein
MTLPKPPNAIWPFVRTLYGLSREKWSDVVTDAQHRSIREVTGQIAKTALDVNEY